MAGFFFLQNRIWCGVGAQFYVVVKGINDDTRVKAVTLHHAGGTVFELSESAVVLDMDTLYAD